MPVSVKYFFYSQEVTPDGTSPFSTFAMVTIINGKSFPQGCGRTKKEAKTNAASVGFRILLGISGEDVATDISKLILLFNICFWLVWCFFHGLKPLHTDH